MMLKVVLSDYQKRYIPDTGNVVTFCETITPSEILGLWGIPEEEISVVTLDGIRINLDEIIRSSGELRLFPGIIGG